MGFLSRFEGKMEDTVEGAAEMLGGSTISPVQIAKKAEKQMRREKIVGAGKQYAPTLYTVLVSVEDDSRMFNYYPTLAGETETYLIAKAAELGYVMDGQPLVRFIADDELKRGKFDVVAEMVASGIVARLRNDELQRYGLAQPNSPRTSQPTPGGAHARGSVPPGAQTQPPSSIAEAYARRGAGNEAAIAGAGAMGAAAGMPQGLRPLVPKTDPKDGFRDLQSEFDPEYDQINSINISEPELEPAKPKSNPYTYEVAQGAYGEAGDIAPQAYGGEPFTAEPFPKRAFAEEPAQPAQAQARMNDAARAADMGADMMDAPFDAGIGDNAPANAIPVSQNPAGGAMGANVGMMAEPLLEVYLYDEMRDHAYRLTGKPQRIGRESSNDIVVPDINASRVHAEIRREPTGAWIITDLGSLNGLFINGRKIKSAPLSDADMIRIGTTELEFQLLE